MAVYGAHVVALANPSILTLACPCTHLGCPRKPWRVYMVHKCMVLANPSFPHLHARAHTWATREGHGVQAEDVGVVLQFGHHQTWAEGGMEVFLTDCLSMFVCGQ